MGPVVAKVTRAEGPVSVLHRGKLAAETGLTGQPLHHRDRVVVDRRGVLSLSFDSGYEIEILPQSEFVIELWSETHSSSPIYINMVQGDYRVISNGILGQLYMVMNRQIFVPSRRPKTPPLPLVISQTTGSPSSDVKTETSPEPEPIKGSFVEDLATEDQIKDVPATLDTLSDKYISEVIAAQREAFSRCQANAVRDNRNAKGNLLFGVTIDPRGVIEDVKVLQSDIDNPELVECARMVFTRARFPSFSGPPIKRSFPLNYE